MSDDTLDPMNKYDLVLLVNSAWRDLYDGESCEGVEAAAKRFVAIIDDIKCWRYNYAELHKAYNKMCAVGTPWENAAEYLRLTTISIKDIPPEHVQKVIQYLIPRIEAISKGKR